MINILVIRSEGIITALRVKGHADSATYGHDLVCSAVSAITFGGLNALKNPNAYKMDVSNGDVHISLLKDSNDHDNIVLETMIIQYKTIEESEKDFVKVVEKGQNDVI